MAKNEIDIINRALVKVGANPIQGLEENSAESIVIKDLYSGVRDMVLSAYSWSFAKKKSILTKTTKQYIDGRNIFILPNDILRLLSVDTDDYELIEGELLSVQDSVFVTYIFRPNVIDFPAYFENTLVAKLASEVCLPLTDSTARTEFLIKIADKEFKACRLIDARQDITGHIIMDSLTGER